MPWRIASPPFTFGGQEDVMTLLLIAGMMVAVGPVTRAKLHH